MSLVPIASLGDHLETPTPTIKAIIHMASLLNKTDTGVSDGQWRNGPGRVYSGANRRLALEGDPGKAKKIVGATLGHCVCMWRGFELPPPC